MLLPPRPARRRGSGSAVSTDCGSVRGDRASRRLAGHASRARATAGRAVGSLAGAGHLRARPECHARRRSRRVLGVGRFLLDDHAVRRRGACRAAGARLGAHACFRCCLTSFCPHHEAAARPAHPHAITGRAPRETSRPDLKYSHFLGPALAQSYTVRGAEPFMPAIPHRLAGR